MFCTSLRGRKEWNTIPSTFLSAQPRRWQESNLQSHDVALPLERRQDPDRQEFFQVILLSASDLLLQDATLIGINRLYHLQGGRNVGVVFLLREKDHSGNGMVEFMSFQASLLSNFDMPLIPLSNLSSLEHTLLIFQKQLKKPAATGPRINAVTALLPYCTNNPPIPEHARYVISDMHRSIPRIAEAATTEGGQKAMHEYLSENNQIVEDIIGFWHQEFIVD